jgi:hypothetical protein
VLPASLVQLFSVQQVIESKLPTGLETASWLRSKVNAKCLKVTTNQCVLPQVLPMECYLPTDV